MKKLVTLLFLILMVNLGFGQAVNAPDPKSFTVNTSAQDASGFELTGFSATSTLLASISLVNPPSGTTFYLGTTTGLTAASGFTLSGNKNRLVVTGTMADINTALTSLKINTGTIIGDINISVAATINPVGFFYNGVNGHFYKPITASNERTTYTNARSRSLLTTFKGQTGYLVTITSASEDAFIFANVPATNVWFAATDEVVDGTWKIDAGPEKGTTMKTQNGQLNGNVAGVYNNWAPGEPNGSNGSENYAVAKWNGATTWNDLSNNWANPYVIEYGTWTNPDDATFTEFYSNSVTHSNGETIKTLFGFKFGSAIDKSKFSAQVFKRDNEYSSWTAADGYKALSGLGKVYLSNQIDTAKVYFGGIPLSGVTNMTQFTTADIGKIYRMTITGGDGGGWGTDIYTSDSHIPAMAVHAGVIAIGQTKEVYIKLVEGKNSYAGTTRNGVTSSEWGGWDLSFQFVSAPMSYKATISPGGVEWSYTNPNASWLNGNSRLLIDMRQVGNIDPTKISNVKILDAYDGPVTYTSHDANGWAIYTVPSLLTKITDGTSAYTQYIRNVNGWNTDYAFQCGIGLTQQGAFKQHKMQLNEYDSAQLKSLYNSIVTVSDVWLAFKEVSNTGIFGNEVGKEFTYGIQYKNADVDDNGVFNEADCFKLLQNLTGVQDLVSSYTLDNTIRLIPDSIYNSIGKSTWSSFQSFAGKEYPFSLLDGTISYNYDLAVAWKGDVNLSHSATPPSNGITTMSVRTTMSTSISTDVQSSIMTELSNGKVYAYITFDPLQQNVVGTQFQLNYDNSVLKFEGVEFKTKGNPTNYGTNKGTFVNLGSLITDGSTSLDNTTEYKVTFTPTKVITNTLGLVGIGSTDAVNKDGKQLKLKVN
jgi:hypothetical protein